MSPTELAYWFGTAGYGEARGVLIMRWLRSAAALLRLPIGQSRPPLLRASPAWLQTRRRCCRRGALAAMSEYAGATCSTRVCPTSAWRRTASLSSIRACSTGIPIPCAFSCSITSAATITSAAAKPGADCWAVKQGVRQGWLDRQGIDQVCRSFGNTPETPTHPSGASRCAASIGVSPTSPLRRSGGRRR